MPRFDPQLLAAAVNGLGGNASPGLFSPPAAPAPGVSIPPEQMTSGEQPAAAPQGIVQGGNTEGTPPPVEIGDESNETSNDLNESMRAENDFKNYLLSREPQPKGAGNKVVYGEHRYNDANGDSRYGTAFDTAPELAAHGMAEGALAQADEGKQLSDWYKKQAEASANQAASVKQRSEADQEEMRRRQEELDLQTKKYSQGLADQGAFWHSPGNIISAIAFGFMPLASNDPAIGIKLLNNAINSDFEKRKSLADSHLGELRSNLSGYRQIAKDREAGDLMAQSESYRIAGLEVQRISSSFQGAKAQAAAKALIADMMQKSNITAMEAYRRLVAVNPQFMNTQLAAALEHGPNYTNFMQKPKAGTPNEGMENVPGWLQQYGASELGKQEPQSSSGTTGGGQTSSGPSRFTGKTQYSGLLDAPRDGTVKGPQSNFEKVMGSVAAQRLERRSPGGAVQAEDFKKTVDSMARAMTKTSPASPQYEDHVQNEKAILLNAADSAAKDIAGNASAKKAEAKIAGTSMLQSDMRTLEKAFGGDEAKLNEFIGVAQNFSPGKSVAWDNLMSKYGVKEQNQLNAAMRFRQVVNRKINDYYRDISGGAISAPEEERLEQVISSKSPWSAIKGFINDTSKMHAAEWRGSFATGNSLGAQLYAIRMGQKYPLLNSQGRKPTPSAPPASYNYGNSNSPGTSRVSQTKILPMKD